MTSYQQPALFTSTPTRGASRKSGPATSREAGRSISGHVLRDQQSLVLSAVGHIDSTAYEVWLRLRDNPSQPKENVVSKRMGELRELGMLRLTGEVRPGASFRNQQCYALTEEGRAWRAAVA